ncbi:hypothetical protein ZWY2020_005847 [Hordeum vulgare]|nr:hypothetical protein ZWY2020_005847 [Hordeum vulgare]
MMSGGASYSLSMHLAWNLHLQVYSTKAQFCDNGQFHDHVIECDTPLASRTPALQVKRLAWKFWGNQTILVDGLPVEVFWDPNLWLKWSAQTGKSESSAQLLSASSSISIQHGEAASL